MGSSKKHKDKSREHRHKRRHRSRSRERHREKRHRGERDGKSEEKRRTTTTTTTTTVHSSGNPEDDWKNSSDNEARADAAAKDVEATLGGGGGCGDSMSIEETNKVRINLGLKPLDVGEKIPGLEEINKPQKKEDVHIPAINIGAVKKTEKCREKLSELKEKRRIHNKLSKIKTLGQSDSEDDDTGKWVEKSRQIQKEKELADKTAKMLEEMDEEFGIGNLVEEEFSSKKKEYSSKDLKGLKVEHALEGFEEEKTVILTLKDQGVLETKESDVLINVNMIDNEKAAKYVENKKKQPVYKPYDETSEEEYGMIKPKIILEKYDEDIDGEKKKKSFELGADGKYNQESEHELQRIQAKVRQQAQTLVMPTPVIAKEYYTFEETVEKFKKVKRKVRKIRKNTLLKADDLLPLPDHLTTTEDYGSRSQGRNPKLEEAESCIQNGEDVEMKETTLKPDVSVVDFLDPEENEEVLGPEEDLTGVAVDEDEAMHELQTVLEKTRKLKQRTDVAISDRIANKICENKPVEDLDDDNEQPSFPGTRSGNIVLNSTSEFCRALGDIPTYGLSGNRDEERDELLDFELELMERRKKIQEEEEQSSRWNEVDIDTRPVNIVEDEVAVLDEEPVINQGLAGALQVATKKGYLENETKKQASAPKHTHLQAQHYSIEDKRYDDLDEKYRKRDRYQGMLHDFKEKESYKPDVKLEYVDDTGRLLNAKEAFRQLSHRFHGKGPGKKKTEKRMKKLQEEQLMKQMSSTDTPLNTLTLLQEKQKQERTPYVLLSGNKGMSANTIAK